MSRRFSIDNLRELSESKLIAILFFEELAKFPIIPKKKIMAKDIVCKYNYISGIGPLVVQLNVIPFINKQIRDISPISTTNHTFISEEGFIKVNPSQQTTVCNVYAAGDVDTDRHYIVFAAASGAVAAISIYEELLKDAIRNTKEKA